MNYVQLSETDEIWQKFHEQITFNKKFGSKAQDFIKVPFKDALGLVSGRQVFLYRGTAFVHITDLNTIARSQFRAKLMSELTKAYKYLPGILKD